MIRDNSARDKHNEIASDQNNLQLEKSEKIQEFNSPYNVHIHYHYGRSSIVCFTLIDIHVQRLQHR